MSRSARVDVVADPSATRAEAYKTYSVVDATRDPLAAGDVRRGALP